MMKDNAYRCHLIEESFSQSFVGARKDIPLQKNVPPMPQKKRDPSKTGNVAQREDDFIFSSTDYLRGQLDAREEINKNYILIKPARGQGKTLESLLLNTYEAAYEKAKMEFDQAQADMIKDVLSLPKERMYGIDYIRYMDLRRLIELKGIEE